MKFADQLGVFSIEDLRELATRRGLLLSESALKARQTLVRSLAGSLERYDSVYGILGRLNEAELAVLQSLLREKGQPGVSALCAGAKADPAQAQRVLDSLRLWGLVFPEGDWEHIVIPNQTRMAAQYLQSRPLPAGGAALDLVPPPLKTVPGARCDARPASFSRDVAEYLARLARSRYRLTQAGRVNRRDLKAMEPAFAVQTAGYSTFLYMLAGTLQLMAATREEGLLMVPEDADAWLAQAEMVRAQTTAAAWVMLRGYPETVAGQPEDYDYVPLHIVEQRSRVLQLVRGLEFGPAVTVESLARRLVWAAPLSFQQWDAARDAGESAARMLRSLYWLGLLAVDDAERPRHAHLTPLGARTFGCEDPSTPALVPEESRFFVQPNAEVFAPPNLSPRTLFHLRRITGEKKGGAAGMFPLTADSLRRALDTGLTVEQTAGFLERFSRTGLPGSVRALVETTGRQHGRIRLVPAGFVLVADEPLLLEELRSLKTVAPLLGETVTERAVAVDAAQVAGLMRNLRQRGYAPLNLAETGVVPPLPEDPDAAPPDVPPQADYSVFPAAGYAGLGPGAGVVVLDELMEETADLEDADEWEPPAPGVAVSDRYDVLEMLDYAHDEVQLVEAMLYGGSPPGEPGIVKFWPAEVRDRVASIVCRPSGKEHRIKISRIEWARLTGESCQL
jgi:hypothetical protein